MTYAYDLEIYLRPADLQRPIARKTMDMDKLSKIGEKKGEKTSFDSIYPLGERQLLLSLSRKISIRDRDK